MGYTPGRADKYLFTGLGLIVLGFAMSQLLSSQFGAYLGIPVIFLGIIFVIAAKKANYNSSFSLKSYLEGLVDSFDLAHLFAALLFVLGITSVILIGSFPPSELSFRLFFLASIGFGVGLSMFIKGFEDFRKLQIVRDTPTSSIGSMAKGVVEVKGKARVLEDEVEAPFSERKGVFYRFEIEEKRQTGKHGTSWVTLDEGKTDSMFAVDDGDGIALVDPQGVELGIEPNIVEIGQSENLPERIEEFLEEQSDLDADSNEKFSIIDNRRKYKEWVIEPGQSLYIFGYSDSIRKQGKEFDVIEEGDAPLFYLSDKQEENLREKWGKHWKSATIGGIALTLMSFFSMMMLTGVMQV